MEDITQITPLATTPPKEAAKNISRSNFFEISPDAYKEDKENLEPQVEALKLPHEAPTETANYLKQSKQQASVAKNSIENMSYFERYAKFWTDTVIDRPSVERDISDFWTIDKMKNAEELSPRDLEKIEFLNYQRQEYSRDDYGINGTFEQLPATISSVVGEQFRAIRDNLDIVGTSTILGGVGGAMAGFAAAGPAGIPTGFSLGARTGGAYSLPIVNFVDGYKMMKTSMFNELYFSPDVKLDNDDKVLLSQGVAFIAGSASAYLGKTLANQNPFLKSFMSPKTAVKILSDPALQAKLAILGYVGQSATVGGSAAVATELARIVGEQFAKVDETDEDGSTARGVIDYLTSKEGFERLTKAGLTGAGAGGLIAFGTSAPAYKKIKSGYVKRNKYVKDMLGPDHELVVRDDGSVTVERKLNTKPDESPREGSIAKTQKLLDAQDGMLKMSEAVASSEMKDLSPVEMSKFKKAVFSSMGFFGKLWVSPEDIRFWLEDPEMKNYVEKRIDESGNELSKIADTPIGFEPHVFSDIVDKFPKVIEDMRLSPLEPNGREGRELAKALQEADIKRQELMKQQGVDKELSPELKQRVEESLIPVKEASDVANQTEYLNRPTFTETIAEGIPNKELEEFNTTQLDARLEVSKTILGDVDKEFKALNNKQAKVISDEELKIRLDSYDNQLKILDAFKTKSGKESRHFSVNHEKKGYSRYAIDPDKMPEDLKAIYADNEILKKRKVFVKGGLRPLEAASMLGFKRGQDLLEVLAKTPSRQEILKSKSELKSRAFREVEQFNKPEKLKKQDEAFTNLSKAHLREAKYMREQRATQYKKGIKRIAKPTKTLASLEADAKEVIRKTPIKDLDYRQFIAGEKRNHGKAIDYVLDNKIEQASKAKEDAAFNLMLAKESIKVQREVKRAEAYVKKFLKPKVQNVLKEAGQMYVDAANTYLDLYKLDLSRRGQADLKRFQKYVKEVTSLGNVSPDIVDVPERFKDVRESATEMTTEQYLLAVDSLRRLEHQAKYKNKLFKHFDKIKTVQTVEGIVNYLAEGLKDHPDYNVKRAEANIGIIDPGKVFDNAISTGVNLVNNIHNIILHLDKEKPGGRWNEIIGSRLIEVETNKKEANQQVLNHIKELGTKFYKPEEFKKLFRDIIKIEEFADYPTLNRGVIKKIDLLTLQALMGDPGARERVPNFISDKKIPMTMETLQSVFDRELSSTDVKFIHNVSKIFESYKQKSYDLELRTNGSTPKMVEGVEYVHKGKIIPGTYLPNKYQFVSDDVKIDKFIDRLKKGTGLSEGELYANLRASESTEQGRMIERTGSDRPLDFQFTKVILDGLEEIIHDINFREFGIDTLKLLKDPILAKEAKSVIGPLTFTKLKNDLIEVVGKANEFDSNFYNNENKALNSAINFVSRGFSVGVLAHNYMSPLIQPESLVNISLRLGKNGPKYISRAAKMIATDLTHLGDYINLAGKLNSDVFLEMDGIDDTVIASFRNVLPTNPLYLGKFEKTASAVQVLKDAQDVIINTGFEALRTTDRIVRVIATLGVSDMILAGDIDAYPKERINKMTDVEKKQLLRRLVQQVTRSTLTASSVSDKAVLQKSIAGRQLTYFWTDLRAKLNTYIAQGRKIKWDSKGAYEEYKKGNWDSFKSKAYGASGSMLGLIAAAAITKMFSDTLRGNDTPLSEVDDIRNLEDFRDYVIDSARYTLTAPGTEFAGTVPGVRDFAFGLQGKRNPRRRVRVELPANRVAGDIATTIGGLGDLLTLSGSKKEVKSALYSMSYITGGIPVNAFYKFGKFIETPVFEDSADVMRNNIKSVMKEIDTTIELLKDKPEAKNYIESLKDIKEELTPLDLSTNVDNLIPENVKEVLKSGEWNYYDPETGAAGVYGFTEERWNQISEQEPSLGLTENGRVSKNQEQQEKAVQWELEDHTKQLIMFEVPVNEKTLYGAHRFGIDTFVDIYNADSDKKLTDILGDAESNPLLKGFSTVKSVKTHISRKVKEANIDNDAQ